MTTTTVPAPSTHRQATAGMVGGALWALWPVVWLVADIRTQETGTLSFVPVAASYWLVAVLGPALVVVGHTALRSVLGADAGRTGTTGMVLACLGLGAVALGNGLSLISPSGGGDSSVAGYVVFYLGFLVSLVGVLLVGITVLRRLRPDAAAQVAGWLMVLAIPLAVAIGMLGAALDPAGETGFSAAVAVPTGVAWLLLGRSLAAVSGGGVRTQR